FIRQERTISTRATPDRQDTNGIGDVVILPKYSLSKGWLIGVGVKLSTGKANFLSNRAIALPADLQPGSGATDALFFTSYQRYSEERPSLSYFGNAIFRITGTNTNYFAGSSYRFGSELQMALGIADRFFLFGQLIDPSLGISYRKRGTDFFDSEQFPASGGTFLFINPGVSIPLTTKISWQVNTSIPIYTFVQDTQLAPTIQVNTGISFKKTL
ncbi:MAG: hypothetical protein AAGA66_16030, partial [Bacteroidota bacterium]